MYQEFVVVPFEPPRLGLRVIGDLDMSTAPELQSALAELAGEGQVTLDLSGLSFIDSTGIHAILMYARSLDGGPPMILANPSKIALRAFEIVGLTIHPAIEIRKDRDGE